MTENKGIKENWFAFIECIYNPQKEVDEILVSLNLLGDKEVNMFNVYDRKLKYNEKYRAKRKLGLRAKDTNEEKEGSYC